MNTELIFALISTAIYLFGAIPYWKDLITGKNIPHIFTYGLWLVLVGFNFFVLVQNHQAYAMIPSGLMVGSLMLGCFYGVVRFKKISINWFDWLCLGLGIFLLVYWMISKNTLNTVILTLVLDFTAFLPTFKKGWLQPWTETIIMYFMSSVGQVATLLSLSGFDKIENSLFWGYLFFVNLIFFFMVFIRRWYLKGWNSIFE